MPRNIEIKARLLDPGATVAKVASLASEGPTVIEQDDTFFACSGGRLKLRAFPSGTGELIFYRRADQAGPKESFYVRSPTASPDSLREALTLAHGQAGRVRKRRQLFMIGRTRVHLDDVEQLPMEVQGRLVRFLRTGQVEPSGSTEAHAVDVRVVAGSRVPLESVAARDLFRVDLAYMLSQFTVEVPPLRDRREDLPLLIQSYVNRFCHETGKRMQGITVKAMSALLNYDYPGNLAELENIARQLVYMSPAGKPVDVNLLPDRVRSGTITTARVDTSSDLDLERLVGGCEQSAIREALRRTHGNKSQAARMLGLSRNGLAIKMERYGLKG